MSQEDDQFGEQPDWLKEVLDDSNAIRQVTGEEPVDVDDKDPDYTNAGRYDDTEDAEEES